MFSVRHATTADKSGIESLYKRVASQTIGIARNSEEITPEYVQHFMDNARATGIELVIEHPDNKAAIIVEMHCYQLKPVVFSHVFSELTILTDPDFHGQGLGKLIFTTLLDMVQTQRTDIFRIELVARESNTVAIGFYKKLGFVTEGRFENRINDLKGGFEADIPMAWFNPNFKR